MAGPDNLRGVDYQVSYTAYRMVAGLASHLRDVASYEIESLNDEAEDLNIHYQNGCVERIQIKKKDEAYHWTPSEIKVILKRFVENQNQNDFFVFVTNAPGGVEVTSG